MHYSFATEFKKGHTPFHKDKTHREDPRIRHGPQISTWKGGITPYRRSLRGSARNRRWQKMVFERDNHICQNVDCIYCRNEKGDNLNAHHIIPFAECVLLDWREEIYDVDNGLTLCEDYHNKYHFK